MVIEATQATSYDQPPSNRKPLAPAIRRQPAFGRGRRSRYPPGGGGDHGQAKMDKKPSTPKGHVYGPGVGQAGSAPLSPANTPASNTSPVNAPLLPTPDNAESSRNHCNDLGSKSLLMNRASEHIRFASEAALENFIAHLEALMLCPPPPWRGDILSAVLSDHLNLINSCSRSNQTIYGKINNAARKLSMLKQSGNLHVSAPPTSIPLSAPTTFPGDPGDYNRHFNAAPTTTTTTTNAQTPYLPENLPPPAPTAMQGPTLQGQSERAVGEHADQGGPDGQPACDPLQQFPQVSETPLAHSTPPPPPPPMFSNFYAVPSSVRPPSPLSLPAPIPPIHLNSAVGGSSVTNGPHGSMTQDVREPFPIPLIGASPNFNPTHPMVPSQPSMSCPPQYNPAFQGSFYSTPSLPQYSGPPIPYQVPSRAAQQRALAIAAAAAAGSGGVYSGHECYVYPAVNYNPVSVYPVPPSMAYSPPFMGGQQRSDACSVTDVVGATAGQDAGVQMANTVERYSQPSTSRTPAAESQRE